MRNPLLAPVGDLRHQVQIQQQNVPVNFTGSTAAASKTVSAISSLAGLMVGAGVSGAGIPVGATIAAIGSASITLSAAASATASNVALVQAGTAQDALGQPIALWSTIRTTWASIRYTTSGTKEDYQSGQFSAQVTHIITIRATSTPKIAPGMRVVFGTHTYLIQLFDDVGLQGVLLHLQCLEIDGSQ